MVPIYDRSGAVVGWVNGGFVLDRAASNHLAFISGEALFTMSGGYVGRFAKGFFRDKRGGAVAFISGATGGPITPIPNIAPIPPIAPIAPIPPIPGIPPIPPIDQLGWGTDWGSFLAG